MANIGGGIFGENGENNSGEYRWATFKKHCVSLGTACIILSLEKVRRRVYNIEYREIRDSQRKSGASKRVKFSSNAEAAHRSEKSEQCRALAAKRRVRGAARLA